MSEITTENLSKEFFVNGYKDYCKRVGALPSSSYRLCKYLFVSEADFNHYFKSLKELQQHIWANLLSPTFSRLSTAPEFAGYTAREKLLAFYYTLMEDLAPQQPLLAASFSSFRWTLFISPQLDALKDSFSPFITDLVAQATETEEITARPLLDDYYQNIFQLHLVFTLYFLGNDTSHQYSDTDAAIEKSTNLLFDLLSRNAGDAAVDFGKFIIQHGFKAN